MTYEIDNRSFKDIFAIINQQGMSGMADAMQILLNEAMKIERSQYLGAEHYERNLQRTGYANGYKPKTVKTRIGELPVDVPQTRDGGFYPSCLEKGLRSEQALNLALAEMYVNGVSTRKVSAVVEKMCGMSVSSQMVSKAAIRLDEAFEKWRTRPLGRIKYLFLDARYESVRVDSLVRDCAVLIAVGIDGDGKRDILGVSVDLSEAEVHWRNFLKSLVKRGLNGVEMIISDAHAGLGAARKSVLPSVPWQRCQFHLQQNAQQYISKRVEKSTIAGEIRKIFNSQDLAEAKVRLDKFVEHYKTKMPDLSSWAEDNIPQGFTVFGITDYEFNRKRLRTTNMLERLNQSIKQRTRIARIFPNRESCLRLVSAVLVETSERWLSGKSYLSQEAEEKQ